MKKTITLLSLLSLTFAKAQVVTADFENFSLPADSFYYSAAEVDFQTSNAVFQYDYSGYWSGGFAYTNKKDSSNGGYLNLYNCIAYNGYNNSNYYATGNDGGIIKLKSPSNFVNGFYISNTTYAWKSMKSGDIIAKKFGGPTGNDKDWFKVTIKGYLGGTIKPDSSTFYLADYRFVNNAFDYILKSWQWFDCSNLGNVDSIQFHLYSSDMTGIYLNTPSFFSIDNFTTSQSVGINEISFFEKLNLYPNPFGSVLGVRSSGISGEITNLKIINMFGIEIKNVELKSENSEINLSDLNSGIYLAVIETKDQKKTYKIIKE